jgi:hypothetical protein
VHRLAVNVSFAATSGLPLRCFIAARGGAMQPASFFTVLHKMSPSSLKTLGNCAEDEEGGRRLKFTGFEPASKVALLLVLLAVAVWSRVHRSKLAPVAARGNHQHAGWGRPKRPNGASVYRGGLQWAMGTRACSLADNTFACRRTPRPQLLQTAFTRCAYVYTH